MLEETLQTSRFLRALRRESVDCTPVWIMRQAGRYLPEYRQVRAQAGDFMSLCKNPELACEVTLQPLRRFALDASILFSDILTIPDAMGLGLYFTEGEGPKFEKPLRSSKAIEQLPSLDITAQLNYVFEAVRLIRKNLPKHIPLIGFSGSPWTLATYMVEGGSSKNFTLIKRMLYAEPESLHQLLEKLAEAVTRYLIEQVNAGVQALMIFDTWGGVLSTQAYETFSLHYMKKIVSRLKQVCPKTPVILFTKQASHWLSMMADTGCDALGVDWTVTMAYAREQTQGKVALQGNMDPAILFTNPEVIRQEVKAILESYGDHPGHIFNLGHGIQPQTPIENVEAFINAVHEFSEK